MPGDGPGLAGLDLIRSRRAGYSSVGIEKSSSAKAGEGWKYEVEDLSRISKHGDLVIVMLRKGQA